MTSGGAAKPEDSFFDLKGEGVQRYVWVSEYLGGLRVLDAGCGYGYGAHYLAGIAKYVLGIDADSVAVQFAQVNYCKENLSFQLMDATKIALQPETFDAVVSFEVIEHLVKPAGYLESISRILKSGGLLFMSTPNRLFTEQFYVHDRPLNKYHVKEYFPNEVEQLLSSYFILDGIYGQFKPDDLKPSGKEHYMQLRKAKVRQLTYVNDCRIPPQIRKFFPKPVKNLFLRMKGLPGFPNTRGQWKDFRIEPVTSTDKLDDRFPVQIYRCEKGISSYSNEFDSKSRGCS